MTANERPQAEDETRFLNVDVDVWSKTDLQPLVSALGRKILVHYVGAEGAEQSAHFSLASAHGKSADAIICRLVALIEKLLPRPRQLWNRARARDFNVGIQAGVTPYSHEIAFQHSTLELVARVRGRIVIATYAVTARTPRAARNIPRLRIPRKL
jgi:hypothetical protein